MGGVKKSCLSIAANDNLYLLAIEKMFHPPCCCPFMFNYNGLWSPIRKAERCASYEDGFDAINCKQVMKDVRTIVCRVS